MNYSQLYAQAFHAMMHGERYWLDETDVVLPKESNEEFRQVTPLEHLLQSCFSIASPQKGDGEWLMTMDIFMCFTCKSTPNRKNVEKNGLSTCLSRLTYMVKYLIINIAVDNVGM